MAYLQREETMHRSIKQRAKPMRLAIEDLRFQLMTTLTRKQTPKAPSPGS